MLEKNTSANDQLQQLFRKRALQYAKCEEIAKDKNHQPYIKFQLKNENFGINFDNCLRVLNKPNITYIPFTLPYIKGVASYDGALIAVIDLLQFMGYGNTDVTDDQHLIVVHDQNISISFLIDTLVGPDHYSKQSLTEMLSDEFSKNSKYFLGTHDGYIAIINIKTIIQEFVSAMKTTL